MRKLPPWIQFVERDACTLVNREKTLTFCFGSQHRIISQEGEMMPIEVPGDGVLTVSEVARELRCSKAHVYKTINGDVAGVSPLPSISLGRRRLVRRSTLEHWKSSNERAAPGAMIDPSLKKHAADA
jgi:excisionase family DNA binding protein